MAERLGQVIYWAACAIAAGLVTFGVFLAAAGNPAGGPLAVLAICGGLGIAVWLAGRAALYVLAAR